jgi:hypothetical protein
MKPGDRVLIAETNAFAHVLEDRKVDDLREGRVTRVILLEYQDGSCEPIFLLADTTFCDECGKRRTIIPVLPEVKKLTVVSKKRGLV